MNVIIAYLETMFGAYPQTPRLLEAKEELRGMMEDAYASLIAEGHSENEAVGQVIRDFGNLDEVAPVLGITSDLAPAAAAGTETGPAASAPAHPVVTLDEAQGYADASERIRFRLAIGVVLFVLSPVALIALPTAAMDGVLPITETVASFMGLFALLVCVAIGVTLVVAVSRATDAYKRLAERRFTANPVVTRWAESLKEQHEPARIRALQVSIVLWILSPVPLIALAILMRGTPFEDFWAVIGVVLVLVFVAAGLGTLLPRTWAHTVATNLTRSGATASDDPEHSIVGIIAAFYWPLLVAIFLAWSFIGNAWHVSWMVWPIGAVLFGAIAGGISALEAYRRARA